MYTALVLDEASKQRLISAVMTPEMQELYPEIIAHHMTINLGPCQMPTELGKPYSMKVVAIGRDEKIIAVKVETDCASKNATKHVTIALDRAQGAKPMMSNSLTNWKPWAGPTLTGVVEECP